MEEIQLYEEVLRLKKAGGGGVLVTVIDSQGSTPRKAGAKMLVRPDGSTVGTVGGGAVEQQAKERAAEVAANGRNALLNIELTEKHGLTCGGKVRLYLEPLSRVPQLVVVGKGHIAQALDDLGGRVGFAVTLLEPPAEKAGEDFSLTETLRQRDEAGEAAVIVACPSHRQDFIATRAALAGQAGFVGVVGSRRKRENLNDYLAEQGCSATGIAAVVSPVGLPIGAETPAEIALSILGQLIERRRQGGR